MSKSQSISLIQKAERAIVVAVKLPDDLFDIQETTHELGKLVEAAGGQVIKTFIQPLKMPDPKTFIGKGKVQEISTFLAGAEINCIVFDHDLKPSQQKNLEDAFGIKIVDRTKIILDIFAQRARTSEAQLQVELAQLEYALPRLTHFWTNLSRLGGGIGTRGPGEQKIEMDRRRIRDRISFIKDKLKQVVKQREVMRKNRKKYINISLVGYTNAGKSTVLKALSKKDVYIKDQLFATLDPLVREVFIQGLGKQVMMSDTVGFIRKLPHDLIDAFKATLEEVVHADALIHVVDISHVEYKEQIHAVYRVLEDLQSVTKPIFTVFNKIDACTHQDLTAIEASLTCWKPFIIISALSKTDIERFMHALGDWIATMDQR